MQKKPVHGPPVILEIGCPEVLFLDVSTGYERTDWCCTVVESDSMVQAPVNQPQSRLNIGVKALATSLEVLMTRTFCMLSDLHCPSYVLLTDRFIIRCTSEVRALLRVSLWRFSWSMATLCVAAMDAPVLRRLLQPRHKRC